MGWCLVKLELAKGWRELEFLVKQLQIGAALLGISGTGLINEMWTSCSGWQEYTARSEQAGSRAVSAARSCFIELIARAGDEIVATCESCHIECKPDLHTMNIYDELSSTATR